MLEAGVKIQEDPEALVKSTMLINEIYEATYQETVELDIKLNENEKTQYNNKWHTHCEKGRQTIETKKKVHLNSERSVHPDTDGQDEARSPLGHFKYIL